MKRQPRALHGGERREWYSIRNAATPDSSSAEVFIYDEIDPFWGVSAGDFVRDLSAISVDEITVRINSPGGNAFDGIAIMNALRAHDARIVTVVEGLAASAASFIAVAGDEVIMRPNTELMVHNAWGIAIGEGADMRKMADDLDRMSDNIAGIYADKAGGSIADWRAVMSAETWYTADEAVDAGLADRVEKPGQEDADTKAKARFDLSMFAHAGRRNAPAPAVPKSSSASVEVTQEREANMALLEDLRKLVGVADDANEETTLKAVEEALEERSETAAGDVAPTQEQIAASASKLGLALVDRAQYDATVHAAAEGREARRQQLAESDQRLVNSAIADGKVPPARRDHWLTALAADREGTTAALASLAPGLVPVEEIGHGQADTTPDTDLSWFGATTQKGA